MSRPIHSDPEWMQIFLRRAAAYFENRPTEGEDRAHWANVYNAENCRKIADEIERLREALQRLAKLEEFVGGKPSCIEEVMNYTQYIARAALGEGKE